MGGIDCDSFFCFFVADVFYSFRVNSKSFLQPLIVLMEIPTRYGFCFAGIMGFRLTRIN